MYKLNEEKMFFDIADGQAVVINFTTGMYYGTSTLGSAVLAQLVKSVSPEKIASAVKKAEGCPTDFDEQLQKFIATLLDKEILVKVNGSDDNDAVISAEAFADGFALTVDEFSEVQDLLLADPVHDVDVEQGWPIMKED